MNPHFFYKSSGINGNTKAASSRSTPKAPPGKNNYLATLLPNSNKRFGVLLALLSICVLTVPAASGQDPVTKPDQETTIRLNTDLVTIDVGISDLEGNRNIIGLKAEDFIVYEDGVRQNISSFSASDVPFNVALLLDTSGSTKSELSLMRKAVLLFLKELRSQDRVAVIQFNSEIELLQNMTSDRSKIEEALSYLESGSGTSFYDAVQLTIDEVLKNIKGRKAIVALTDGVDSFGYHTYEQVRPLAESLGASLYFLELETEAFTEPAMMLSCTDKKHFKFSPKQLKKYYLEHVKGGTETMYENHCMLTPLERMQINRRLYQSARRELREMADKSGGHVYTVKKLDQIDAAYYQIASELRTLYSLVYYPTNENRNGKWRSLRVSIKRPGLIARTRPGYRAPLD